MRKQADEYKCSTRMYSTVRIHYDMTNPPISKQRYVRAYCVSVSEALRRVRPLFAAVKAEFSCSASSLSRLAS